MASTAAGGGVCEHNALIRRQFMKIESLESEVCLLRLERDALLEENERLHFQLQCLELDPEQPHAPRPSDPSLKSSQSTHALSQYELSQQLIDRRVDALERKYGGQVARDSAVKIQRAFRTYRLQKRFKTIAFQALRQTNHVPFDQKADSQSTRSDDSQTTLGRQDDVFVTPLSSLSSQQQLECQRKRQYRVGLNLFNKHPPERGVHYLLNQGFIERAPNQDKQAAVVARFLLSRKGVSKAMIGDYLSTNKEFQQKVLQAFVAEVDFHQMPLDGALRKFQTLFRFPGEAQKIERLVEAFAAQYVLCNASGPLSRDAAFILSFAIIMLNTDLHAPTNARNRMTANQWLQNLRGVFSEPISDDFLLDIYHRIRAQELRTGADHVTQVLKVQQALVAPSRSAAVPNLVLESRRLVCYCRLFEVKDRRVKDRERHQREVFLFNDLLLVTKLSPRTRNQRLTSIPEYIYRLSVPLEGLSVHLFSQNKLHFGIDVRRRQDDTSVLAFNARNELDQKRFAEDLRESIAETDEMEALRIAPRASSLLSLDRQEAAEGGVGPPRRKSSSGSLDSGLSLPSRDHSPQTAVINTTNS